MASQQLFPSLRLEKTIVPELLFVLNDLILLTMPGSFCCFSGLSALVWSVINAQTSLRLSVLPLVSKTSSPLMVIVTGP